MKLYTLTLTWEGPDHLMKSDTDKLTDKIKVIVQKVTLYAQDNTFDLAMTDSIAVEVEEDYDPPL